MSISLLSLLLFTSASIVPCEAFFGKIFNGIKNVVKSVCEIIVATGYKQKFIDLI